MHIQDSTGDRDRKPRKNRTNTERKGTTRGSNSRRKSRRLSPRERREAQFTRHYTELRQVLEGMAMQFISPSRPISSFCPEYNWEDSLAIAMSRLASAMLDGKIEVLNQHPCPKPAFVYFAKRYLRWTAADLGRENDDRRKLWEKDNNDPEMVSRCAPRQRDTIATIMRRDESQSTKQLVHDALPELNARMPNECEALILFAIFGCSQGDIARYQRVTREAVNRRIKKAREELKKLLPEWDA